LASSIAKGAGEVLDDPEAQAEEWTQEVTADDEADATRRCEWIALNATEKSGKLVKLLGKLQRKRKSGTRWVCFFQGEV
jgi:hypothetical protein